MSEAGGPTTQSGILYQNSVAALYLGRMLDTSQRPDNERVIQVRVEVPEHVDDIVVRFADEHRLFIQAKESIKSTSREWSTMWKHFDQQFRNEKFQHNQDRLLLQIGNWRDEHDHLNEMCKRAKTSSTVSEWYDDRINKAQEALLKKIKLALPPTGLTDEYLLQLLGHIDIEIVPLRALERDSMPRWMPITNKFPIEIFRLLRDRVGGESRVRGEFTAYELRKSLIIESSDLQFDIPTDITELQTSLKQCGSLLRQHKHTFADTNVHIERDIVDQIVEWLLAEDDDEKNVAMLLDQAGMGKTVVMQSVLYQLEARGFDVLAIKADQQLSNITALPEIQHKLALPYSPEQIISRLAQLNRVVVLIDQIDALSLSLAHDQPTLDTTLDLIARLQRIPNVRILLSCRIFDRNTDPRLKHIELDRSFSLQPLDAEQVIEVLTNLQVDETTLSQTTLELLRVPLHLDLFARAVANESTIEQLRGIGSLQELYALIWQNVVLKQQKGSPFVANRIEVINQLTSYMNQQQRTTAPQSLLQTAKTAHLEHAVNWLASVGILLRGKTEWSFLHQTFFDYCYARQFVDDGGDIVATILESKQGIFERPKLIQIIAYLRGSDHHRYISDLQRLLNAPDLRFHLYDVLLRWFGSLHNPTDDEWLIAQQTLRDNQKRAGLIVAMHGSVGWFTRLRPWIEARLEDNDDEFINMLMMPYLTSLADVAQTEVSALLNIYVSRSDEWNLRIIEILSRIRVWYSIEAAKLFEKILYELSPVSKYHIHVSDAVVRAFPQIGCRIVRFLLDDALETHFQKLSEQKSELEQIRLIYFSTLRNAFDNLEHQIEKSISYLSKTIPETFLEQMLPFFEKVLSVPRNHHEDHEDYLSDIFSSHVFYSDLYSVHHALIQGMITGLVSLVEINYSKFNAAVKRLESLPYKSSQRLIAHAYTQCVESCVREAFEFLLADKRRLSLGEDSCFDSRQLVKAIYPFLDDEQRNTLECHILTFRRKPRYLYDLHQSGREQLFLLQAVPQNLLTDKGSQRLRELERKFPNLLAPDKPSGRSEMVAVASPISKDEAQHMSDRAWLRAMGKYRGKIRHLDFGKGGSYEFSGVLAELIKENPTRYYQLFRQIPDDLDDHYVTAFVNGFAESTSTQEWFFSAIRRFATQEDRDIRRPVAWAIEKRKSSNVPNDILDLLINWIYESMNDDEMWWKKGDNHGDAFHSYLNSDRGATFGAVMRVLDARNTNDARGRKWDLIEFVASDLSTALRIGAIHELTYMIQYDRLRAWSLFEQLIDGHEVLLEAHYVREFLYWSFYKNYMQVSRYLEMMMHYSNEEVQERGAGLACVAAISGGAIESEEAFAAAQALADQAISGLPAWRRGAAHIYTYNMTHGSSIETQQLCQEKVCQLFDDEDKEVREKINHKFYAMSGEHFFELRKFMEEYAFAKYHPLEHHFAEYLWEHGMQDPSWSLAIVQTILNKEEQPDQWRSGIEELMRLILRIYTSPLVDDAIKNEALDTFDLLMRQYAGTANKILSEWDRR
ncbi:MAG: ATP-binding protein [Anaerolineae bacterium]|nr:ATP-binding protein [Anaerolineae bacterium]